MQKVMVTVDDDSVGKIHEVADELRSHGLQINAVNEDIGIITGSVSDGEQSSLESVPGVLSVEGAITYHVPPDELGRA